MRAALGIVALLVELGAAASAGGAGELAFAGLPTCADCCNDVGTCHHGHGECGTDCAVCTGTGAGQPGDGCNGCGSSVRCICSNTICHEHGECVSEGSTRTCTCAGEWGGANCAEPPCQNHNDCGAHGACETDGDGHKCRCAGEWGGAKCTEPPCHNHNDCGEHGACETGGDDHKCKCAGEWGGANCTEQPCQNHNDCGEHGTCETDGDGHKCSCRNDYIGGRCEHAPCTKQQVVSERDGPFSSCNDTLRSGQRCYPNCTLSPKQVPRNMDGRSPDGSAPMRHSFSNRLDISLLKLCLLISASFCLALFRLFRPAI